MGEEKLRLGCVGLGDLGFAIAGNLLAAGFAVTGYRRSALDAFTALGGTAARSSAEVMAQSDIVLTCLPSDEALKEVFLGENGLLSQARPGQVVIDITTATLDLKNELRAGLGEAGAGMLDCPMSGRPDVVRRRQSPIFVSGDEALVETCRPVFAAISDRFLYLGPFGSGSVMKYITNLLLTVHVMAVAEAMEIGAQAGLNPMTMVQALTGSAAESAQIHIRTPTIVSGKSPVPRAARSFGKDIRVIHDFVAGLGCAAPLFETALNHWENAESEGFGGQDSVLMFTAILRQLAAEKRGPAVPPGGTP